jgi:Tol biopolymer transport system component
LKRTLSVVWLLLLAALPAGAQRRPVLGQIDEPHPYYYRELYLPQLTSGPSSLTWGPDSDELIYSMAGSLWRQKLAARDTMQITDGEGYDYQPDWSPDGKSVVYVSYQKDSMELWLLDLRSGTTHPLTTGGAVNVEPRWSPDGTKILWVSTEYNKRFHIFAADIIGGELKNKVRLTGETKSSLPRYYYSQYDMEINPTWTRDGKEILFVSNRDHIHGTGGFWKMKAEPGAEAHEIHYEETNWKARPDFSPDGSRMVYSSYLGRQWHNLWLMPATGGDAFPFSYGDWDETNVRWSPDGKRLAYISNQDFNTEIRVSEIAGGAQFVLQAQRRITVRRTMSVSFRVVDEIGNVVPARVSLTDENGRSYAPDQSWIFADDGFVRGRQVSETHYFHTRGTDTVTMPVGQYHLDVVEGLERPLPSKVTTTASGTNRFVQVELNPKFKLSEAGGTWVSGDLHVHMNYGGMYRNEQSWLAIQGAAEGISVLNELTVNKEQRFPDVPFLFWGDAFKQSPQVAIVQGQEFHTSYWGHRGILGLKDHLLLPGYAGYPDTAAASLFPMNADVYDMAHEQGALVGAVHPFDEVPDPFVKPEQRITDELPVDVALGKLDYMEIVGFSDHKATAAVWYKLLNLGFKLPAGGGTDATMNYAAPIRGTVGQDRVYVWMPNWPSNISTWMDQLRQGRTFATNGPLIELKLGGEMVGSELKVPTGQAAVPFTAKLRSIVPIDHLELVCNGNVAQELKLNQAHDSADVTGTIPLKESGWCLLRAWSDKAEYPVMDNYAYATTSPVYVTVGGKRAVSKIDAEYFVGWIDRVAEITDRYPDWNSADEKKLVRVRLREAREVYKKLSRGD